jgi:prepilin-type N-terminal cleavage/methylation domain-containing protein
LKGKAMNKNKGFTILELLTVVIIIALLMSIMVPGIRKAKQSAMNLRQKSQLRDIGMSLEFWFFDHDMAYPDSNFSVTTSLYTTGAHKLAEALMGRDGHGFDSKSTWDAKADEVDPDIYGLNTKYPYIYRESVYMDPDEIGNFQIAQIYPVGGTGAVYPGDYDETPAATSNSQAGVLTDIFKKKRITMPISNDSVKIGSPILYFKGNHTTIYNASAPDQSIFNYTDNMAIFALGHNIDGFSNPHPFANPLDTNGNGVADGVDDFYASLVNPTARITGTSDPEPYNKDTFVLMSAGSDGLYGTSDDITNISK